MNYSFMISPLDQFEIRDLISLDSLILGNLPLTHTGLYLTLVEYVLFIFILVNNSIGTVPYSFASTSHFILTFSLGFTVVLGATILGLNTHGLEFISYLAKNIFLGSFPLATNIKWGLSYPPRPHLLTNLPLQSKVFSFRNFLGSLKIKFKDPKFWINWLCTVLTIMFIRYLYAYSGLDIGWLLECFSLSSIGFFTRQIFSDLFDAIRLPVGAPFTLYMDNTGNPSSSGVVNSGGSGNQQGGGTNPLTPLELKEIISKLGRNTTRITVLCTSLDSKIENLQAGYTERKYDSLARSLQSLNDAQNERNTLFGDVYARNGDASALPQTQYPESVHNTIIRAQNILHEHRR